MRPLISLFQTMSPRQRLSIASLTVVVLIASLLEVVGVGAILPVAHFIQAPAAILTDDRLGPAFRYVGVNDSQTAMITLALVVVVVFIVKNVVLALQVLLVNRRITQLAADFSVTLLRNYIYLPYGEFTQVQNSAMIRNMTAEVQITCNAIRGLLNFFAEIVITLGLIAVLWYAEPIGALIATCAMVLIGGIMTRAVRSRVRVVAKTRLFEEGERLRWLRRALGGFKEIRILSREEHFLKSFQGSTFRVYDALARGASLNAIPPLVLEAVAVTAMVGFLIMMLELGRQPAEIFSVVALFGVAAIRLIPATKKIASGINSLRFQLPSIEIVAEQLRLRRGPAKPRRTRPGRELFRESLTLENVSYVYPGVDRPAVRDLSLTVRRGEKIGIVGPSGAGKTTLVDIILGLLVPTSGSVSIDGLSIYEDIVGWQKTIGYIPQAIYLSDDTLRRNIAFGIPDDEVDESRIWACLKAAQLADFVADLSEGLETWAGERGIRLSGGQRQRIGIARALYHDPQLIVLDEATSQLDTETERLLESAIRDLARDRTLLVIAHRISTVRNADRICAMSDGRIESMGSFEKLRLTSPLFQRLLDSSEIKPDGDRIPDAIRS